MLISFTIAGIVLFSFMDNYVSKEKVKGLEQYGNQVLDTLNTLMENRNDKVVTAFIQRQLQHVSMSSSPYIWIGDTNGNIIYNPNFPDNVEKNMQFTGKNYRFPDDRQYKKVINSKVTAEERGNFYGLFSDTGYSWLVIESPFIYSGKVLVTVYTFIPITEIKKTRATIINFFLISVTISICISLIFVYFFSLRISRPLMQIRNALKVIARGEFQKRLNIKSKDEIGELARSFDQMATDLQNVEELRRSFIANVSHEFRTPITSIRGFVEGILDGTIPLERQNNYLKIVRDETMRLGKLVTDLLDLSKMESGEINLNLINFNITELIRRNIIKLESLIVSKNIKIEADFEEDDMKVHADIDSIDRVIINLIHNAVKFSNENGKIIIRVNYQKDKTQVSIEDSGIGIDEKEIHMIWNRFYKSDKSRGKDKTGTGLGLAIAKKIIYEHNGEIWVTSELGKGSKFTFTLEKDLYEI